MAATGFLWFQPRRPAGALERLSQPASAVVSQGLRAAGTSPKGRGNPPSWECCLHADTAYVQAALLLVRTRGPLF